MAMLKCRICGGNCDPGDLIGGICDDCRTEKSKEEQRQDEMSRLSRMVVAGQYEQMEVEEILNGW